MPTKREKRAAQKDEYTDIDSFLDRKGGNRDTYLNLPEGYELFQPSKDTHKLRILPYRVGKGNPNADEGKLHLERTFYVHKNIGPNKSTYCCPLKNFNKPCPVCNWVEKQRKKLDDEELKELDLFPKERQLFLVRDEEDRKKGIQVFDYSYHLFGKQLQEKLKRLKRKNEKDPKLKFWRLEDGKVLVVEFDEKKYQKATYYTTAGISFKDPVKPLKIESVDDLPCLDEIPVAIKPEKLKEIFLQTSDEDDEDEEDTKKKKGKKRPKDEDEDDDDTDEDEEEEEDDDEDEEGDDDSDDDDGDDEDDDSDDDEDDADDDDDDGDDEDDDGDEEDSDDEDSDDDDEDDEEDEEEDDEDSDDEDDEPVKKKGKKGKKSSRDAAFDTDDDDEEEDGDDDEGEDAEESDSDDPTAEEAGIKVGMKVKYKKGKGKVVHISPDGTSLRIETADGETVRGVAPREVTILKKVKN